MNKNSNPHLKTYTISMILCFSIYTALIIGINILDNLFDLPQWQRITMAILPVLPAIAMIFIILRFVRTTDEVWQRIIAESTIISACVVGIGTFTLGFLEGVIDLPGGLLIWVWPAMIMIYGIAAPVVRLRYS